MRVRIVFILKNKGAFVPFHHQYLLDQLIEDILAGTGRKEEYINYNFSGLKGQTKVSKKWPAFLFQPGYIGVFKYE